MKSLRVRPSVYVIAAVVLALLLAPVMAQAQGTWTVVSSPSPGVLNAVASVSANDVWAVGTNNSQTLTQHWNGTAWSVVPSPNARSSDKLNGVAAITTSDVWAVGSVNNTTPPLIIHWNGTSWRAVKAPNQDGFLNAVAAVSSKDVWAVGDFVSGFERTLIEHWNGRKWSVVSSPSPGTQFNELNGVTAVSANDVWAVGITETNGIQQTLIEHWDGTSWSVVPSPNEAGTVTNQLYAVAAAAANNVWAVGEWVNGSTTESLIEHWDGTSWSLITNPGAGQLTGIAIVSPTEIWAVGSQLINFTNFETLIEQWDGTSWTVVSSPNPGANSDILNGVSADPTSGQSWAVGDFADPSGGGTLTLFNP